MEDFDIEEAMRIRHRERSRGGVSFEVILDEPASNTVVPERPVTPGRVVSAAEITEKLNAAEERRKSLGQKKMAGLSNQLAKVGEATRKIDEKVKGLKEQLDAKMGQHVQKREAVLGGLKEKLKMRSLDIVKARQQLVQQKSMDKDAIDEKMKNAQILRDLNIKKMKDRLKEHNRDKMAEIKNQFDLMEKQKAMEKARSIEQKLSAAEIKREKELKKKVEKVQDRLRRGKPAPQDGRFDC